MNRKTILYSISIAILSLVLVLGTRAVLHTTHAELSGRNETQRKSIEYISSLNDNAAATNSLLLAIAESDANVNAAELSSLLLNTSSLISTYTDSASTDSLRQAGRNLGWAHFDIHGIGDHIIRLIETDRADEAAALASNIALKSHENYRMALEELRNNQYSHTALVWSSFAEHYDRNATLILFAVGILAFVIIGGVFLATKAVKGMARDHDALLDELLREQEALSPSKLYEESWMMNHLAHEDLIEADLLPNEANLALDQSASIEDDKEWGPHIVPFEERKPAPSLKEGRKAYDSRGLVLIKA